MSNAGPTLVIHGGAGVLSPTEFFLGLRRRAEQKDYAKRLQQFFDHYLWGAPAPAWLEHGIPHLERDAEKLRFNSRN